MIELFRATWAELVEVEGLGEALRGDFRALTWRGPRARQATIAAGAVMLAVALTEAAHLDMPWWAGISAFLSVQATRPGSVERVALRIVATALGAALALLCAPALIEDPLLTTVFLFAVTMLGILGTLVANHSYAWFLFAVTPCIVILMAIGEPGQTLHIAVYRCAEVTIGALSGLAAVLLLQPASPAPAPPHPPGFHDLTGAQWPAVLHALRSAITVALLPWIWKWFDFPSVSQMAVTVVAVLSVPMPANDPFTHGRRVAGRAFQRIAGCALGGIAALLLLGLSVTIFPFWLAMLGAGVWVCAWVQATPSGIGYVGTQAGIVFVMSLVQGLAPSTDLNTGVERLAGMIVGVTVLFLVSLMIWPESGDLRNPKPEPA